MSEHDNLNLIITADATVTRGAGAEEEIHVKGRYDVECIGPNGEVKWRDAIENVVMTGGKNFAFDTFLAGSAYTVVGPFMGLISSVSYGAGPVAGDTMTSHPGWTEAGGINAPSYTAPRKTCVWSAASGGSKSLSAALAFGMTGTGTVKGCFLVFGAGALSTIDNTAGTLWSAGLFTAGDKTVASGDTVNVTYSVSM